MYQKSRGDARKADSPLIPSVDLSVRSDENVLAKDNRI